ncbi:AMP-binding protein, partial [Francisella philomiragia]
TTGLPKGVMVNHYSVNNLISNSFIEIHSTDSFTMLASTIFDASILEIFTPLLNGCRLIIPKDHRALISSAEIFLQYIQKNRISVLWLTKTLFDSLYNQDNYIFKELKYLLIGGEELDLNILNKLISQKANKSQYILNGYGPTESTTFTTIYSFEDKKYRLCPIGKPLDNIQTYILDQY